MEVKSLKRKAVCNLVFSEMYKNKTYFSNYGSKFLRTEPEKRNNLTPNNKNAIYHLLKFKITEQLFTNYYLNLNYYIKQYFSIGVYFKIYVTLLISTKSRILNFYYKTLFQNKIFGTLLYSFGQYTRIHRIQKVLHLSNLRRVTITTAQYLQV